MNSHPQFEVSRVPFNKPRSSFWTKVFPPFQLIFAAPIFGTLTFPEPQVARVKRAKAVPVLTLVIIICGLGLLVFPAFEFRHYILVGSEHSSPLVFDVLGKIILIASGVFGIAGLALIVFGVHIGIVAGRRVLTFERRIGLLRFKPPCKGLGSEIPLRDVAALQILVADAAGRTYETNLVLSRPKGKRLTVICHDSEQDMRSDAEKLAAFLHVPLLDHVRESAEVNGLAAELETTLIPGKSASFRTMVLRSVGSEQMILKPAFGSRVFNGCFVVLGLLGLGMGSVFGLAFLRKLDWIQLVGFLSCSVLGVVFIVLYRKLKEHPIVFDRVQGIVWSRGPGLGERISGEIPLRNIQALQMCSDLVWAPDQDHEAFQLNLVLAKPPGRRIELVTHGNERALRQDAQQLAQFLRVPLLDHTGRD